MKVHFTREEATELIKLALQQSQANLLATADIPEDKIKVTLSPASMKNFLIIERADDEEM